MAREILLRRIAGGHALLIAAVAISLRLVGRPLDGLLLGGALAGLSFVSFWAMARTLVEPRRKALAYALGTLKILLYFGLTAAVLTGRLVADPVGFALGVSCFVFSAIGMSLMSERAPIVADHYGSA